MFMVLVAALEDPVYIANRASMKNQLNFIYSKNNGWTGYLVDVCSTLSRNGMKSLVHALNVCTKTNYSTVYKISQCKRRAF